MESPLNDEPVTKDSVTEPMVVTTSHSQNEPMVTAPYSAADDTLSLQTASSQNIGLASDVSREHSASEPIATVSDENVSSLPKETLSGDVSMQSSSLNVSAASPSLPEIVTNDGTMSAAMDVDNISVKSEPTSEKSLQQQIMTPPLKSDSIYSPTRSLTPMSEKIEGVSPVELIETPDGSVRIKGELDPVHLLAGSIPRSRSSSQSSKSSKGGSPRNRQSPSLKGKKKRPPPPKDFFENDKNDFYCWVCHKEGEVLCCELCPRVMHAKCLHLTTEPEGDWYCPECEKTMTAECKETQSRAMSQLTIDQLALHLRYALQRMKTSGVEPFLEPVNTKEFTDYLDYVFHPMDINTLEKNIKKKTYGSTEAFLADVKWILHNCVIYNGPNAKLTNIAKVIVKIAQHEMSEIEVCPECYLNACRKRENWFCEPCRDLHILVWAKLQGFPHWPAKALRIEKGLVDVRFFGQHDRAWIPLANCYLMSKEMPLPVKNKKKGRGPGAKGGLDSAMQEAQVYINNVIKKTGEFEYAPPRTPLTHLDLCRKPTAGQAPPKAGTENPSELAFEEPIAPSSLAGVKKEEITEEGQKPASTDSTKSTSADRILNLKIGPPASDINLSAASVPQKKKSKVVTTSGAHPEKGYRPFAPKKKASHALLDKTIESCKASLRDNMESKSEDSSSESDSSLEEEMDSSSQNSSSPDKGKKSNDSTMTEDKSSKLPEDSDSDLVIDVQGDEDGSKKKDSAVSALLEKGSVKLKKKSESETKPIKTKSILLNKDPDPIRKSSSPATVSSTGGVKRKQGDDASSSSKVRRVDTPTKSEKTQKPSAKSNPAVKDRKHSSDNDKQKKPSDGLPKSKKDGLSPHAGSNQKKLVSSDPSSKKKIMLSSAAKPRSDEGEKTDLKTTAKMLAKKMMAKKQSPSQEKTKAYNPTPAKPPLVTSNELQAKKLSSFTIPKHKPSPVRVESNSDASSNPSSKYNNHTSQNASQTSRPPSISAPLQKLKKYNDKVMQSMQNIIVEMYEDMVTMFKTSPQGSMANNSISSDVPLASQQQINKLQLDIEHLKWSHQQQIAEIQHNHDLTIAELRQSLDNEKHHLLEAAKRKSEAEKLKAVEETKKKQWCANCGKEAMFYCCWNTSYCDYPCQQIHWPKHMGVCSQARDKSSASNVFPETPTKTDAPKEINVATTKVVSSSAAAVKTTPTKKTPEKMVIPDVASPPKPEETSLHDDDHSDTDMMIIDETESKPDILSPVSPDDLKPSKTVPIKSPVFTAASPTKTVSSTSIASSQSSLSATTTAPIVGAVVKALINDQAKPLLSKTSVGSPGGAANSSTATKVVSSKLIDDIFSKVHKETSVTMAQNQASSVPMSQSFSVTSSPPSSVTSSSTSTVAVSPTLSATVSQVSPSKETLKDPKVLDEVSKEKKLPKSILKTDADKASFSRASPAANLGNEDSKFQSNSNVATTATASYAPITTSSYAPVSVAATTVAASVTKESESPLGVTMTEPKRQSLIPCTEKKGANPEKQKQEQTNDEEKLVSPVLDDVAQPRISQSLEETDPGEELQPLDADGDVIMEPETGETQAEEKKNDILHSRSKSSPIEEMNTQALTSKENDPDVVEAGQDVQGTGDVGGKLSSVKSPPSSVTPVDESTSVEDQSSSSITPATKDIISPVWKLDKDVSKMVTEKSKEEESAMETADGQQTTL